MLKKIKVASGGAFMNTELNMSVVGGKIVRAVGYTGLTQFEEEVTFNAKPDSFAFPHFIFMHYQFFELELAYEKNAKLVFHSREKTLVGIDIDSIRQTPVFARAGGPDKPSCNLQLSLFDGLCDGRLTVAPDSVTAGTRNNFVLTYVSGERGIRAGGGIEITGPCTNFSAPERDLVNARSDNAACELKTEIRVHPMRQRGFIVKVTLVKGALKAGDKIYIDYASAAGIEAQTYSMDKLYFLCVTDDAGTGSYRPHRLCDSAAFCVREGRPARMRLKAQQFLRPNEAIETEVIALDAEYNLTEVFEGKGVLTLAKDGRAVETKELRFIKGRAKASVAGVGAGSYVLTAAADGLCDECLVLSVNGSSDRAYFGEIHGHSEVSDGMFTPAHYFEFARREGLLDFCALTDHDWEIVEHPRNDGLTERLLDLVKRENDDGRFVTIPAYEWMGKEGHINLYFLKEADFRVKVGVVTFLTKTKLYKTVPELLAEFAGEEDVLTIPHFSHGYDISSYDPEMLKVAEIYSHWGDSENGCAARRDIDGAFENLCNGYKFGFIGGGDNHHGKPGQMGRRSRYAEVGSREGYAVVFAKNLTRKDIFCALKSGTTYATDGERMLGAYSADLSEGCRIGLFAGGTKKLKSIEIITEKGCVKRIEPDGLIFDGVIEIEKPSKFFYIRVKQDGGAMWLSPCFV